MKLPGYFPSCHLPLWVIGDYESLNFQIKTLLNLYPTMYNKTTREVFYDWQNVRTY